MCNKIHVSINPDEFILLQIKCITYSQRIELEPTSDSLTCIGGELLLP